MFDCDNCGKSFTRADNRSRHMLSSCKGKRIKVDHEQLNVTKVDKEYLNLIKCEVCNVHIEKNCYTAHIRSNSHRCKAFVIIDDGVKRSVGTFGDRIVSYQICDGSQTYIDIDEFAYNVREKVIALVDSILNIHVSTKVNVELYALYYLLTKENVEIKSFNTRNKVITNGSDLYDTYSVFIDEIKNKMSEFQERDSGWTLSNILYLDVNMNKYNPMRGSSYVDLPQPIKKKKAIINVQNADNACFAWAITSALREPVGLPQRVSSYPHYNQVADFTDITFPMILKDILKFEERNNISVNVYGLEECFKNEIKSYDVVGPLYFTKRRRMAHINLLLLSGENSNSHYCWIKNLSRLVSSQKSLSGHQRYICEGCLTFFTCEAKLRRHENEDCKQVKAVFPGTDLKINKYGEELPENILKFDKFEKQLRLPFVIYADFEALLKPIDMSEPDPSKPFTVKCFEHEPYSYAYYIKCSFNNDLSKLCVYRGKNAATSFIREIERDATLLYDNYLRKEVPMKCLTDDELDTYNRATVCHICEKEIVDNHEKVRDHDHMTGIFRGAAHSVCNINYKDPRYIPIIFHNLSNYDTHLFVKVLALEKEEVDVIAQNKEKYVSFSKKVRVGNIIDCNGKRRNVFYKLRFIDSLRFLNSSLMKLSSYLSDEQCKEVRRYFTGEKFDLIRQKGVFPYTYVTSYETLDSTELPSRECFYDILSDSEISDEHYLRAQTVWNLFECTTLGQYSDIYLQSDVLLLADVFENFRGVCLDNYKLDPAHYFTSPGLSWDAMLRMTGINLELLTDVDMFHFFKKGIRGGVSMCSKRKEIANNEYVPYYDPSEPKKYILYLDATNLYGYAMSFMLPCGGFQWLTAAELLAIDVQFLADDGDYGYVFEVDLEYPAILHDQHNDFPFCPEHVVPPTSKYEKLIPTLTDKSNYIIHYTTLKQCISNGLILRGIRRGIRFRQGNWLKKYIDFNTMKRNEATNEFANRFYKSMVNSIFGKTMENVENRVNIKLVSHWETIHKRLGAEAYIARPNFKSCKIFSDTLTAIELAKVRVEYVKPIYVGFTILELAKAVIYNFYYNFLKPSYDTDVSLLYTDTDSLIIGVQNYNVYNDIRENSHMFDTSNYSEGNIHGIPRSLPRLGKMKDEYAGEIVECFYGTGAKAYCLKLANRTVKTAKGVRKYVIDKNLSVNDYKNVVQGDEHIIRKMYIFRSDFHTVFTELINKVALSSKDDKRYILPDRSNTLAWGHYRIEDITREENLQNLVLEIDALR